MIATIVTIAVIGLVAFGYWLGKMQADKTIGLQRVGLNAAGDALDRTKSGAR